MIAEARKENSTAGQPPASAAKLVFFDENVIRTSPAGSCVLAAVQALATGYSVDVVCNRLESSSVAGYRKIAVALPRGPVLVRSVLFTLLSCCVFPLRGRKGYVLKISTQGVFPFCDVSYAHCCHRLFLTRLRPYIGGGILRRTARLLNHAWGALTERVAFRRAEMVVVPSEGLARELVSAYGASVERKIRLLPNPVETERFRRPADFSTNVMRSRWSVSSDSVLFSFCALGNFEWKGLRLALEALTTLHDERARLLIIGGKKTEIAEYSTIAARLGVERQVRFVGLQADIRPFLWASDAFLFPSAHETFPLVCLQAAAAGLPLLTTPLHGVEEFAADGGTGWIVERTTESIAEAMRSALNNGTDLPRMGEAARIRASRYGLEQFQARWRELIAELSGPR